jgi:hypothetical protein
MCRSDGAWSWRRLSPTARLEIDEVGLHSFPLSRLQAILAMAPVPVVAQPAAGIMTAAMVHQLVDVLDGNAICDASEHDLVAQHCAAAPMIPFESGVAAIDMPLDRDLARLHRLGAGESYRHKPGRQDHAQDGQQRRHAGLDVLAVTAQGRDDRLHGASPALR